MSMSFFNFGGFSSPPKSNFNATSPTSPFCTSPSQLQEVTLDQDVTTFQNTMGLRSPTGGALRGRSVKEIEEQLSNLKKENFNLKLRIYFLEEKMGTNFTLDKDNIVKKNIELQIEIANLQKEVQEKHQLLCQAVKAMELEEEEHKKYISSKEGQLSMCQQELEDLRMQLQDTKFESDGVSIKSDTTGFYSGRATNSGNHVADLQERIKTLEDELLLEKENNASLQFVIGQAEMWKIRYETMQKEFQVKDDIIKNLTNDIENANKQISNMINELKESQEKYENTNKENHALRKTIQADNKKIEEVGNQIQELRKKYSMTKADLEREQKKCERIKMMSDIKVTEIEEENQKQKMKIRDLQTKLETAMMEIRKNQNLAVPKSPKKTSNVTNIDKNSISVQDSATSPRVAEKDPLHVSIKEENQEKNQNSSSSSSTSKLLSPCASSPAEKFNVKYFEDLLNTDAVGDIAGCQKILSHFQIFKKEHHLQSQKIIKLKSEQMKACEIIKTMIESRNKANEEINLLKEHIKELEHELESVVTKQTNDGGDTLSLKQKITELNITAVGKNEDEKSSATSMCESSSKQNVSAITMEDVEMVERYKALTNELEAKAEILVAILNEKDYQLQKLRQQYQEILTTLEEREKQIVDLEFELLTTSESGQDVDQSLLEKTDRDSEKRSSFYRQEIEEKNKEIEKLTVELKKCTCYLQEIVNKELWAKNKEIEKLHNKQANSPELSKLKKELSVKDYQLNALKSKISELGLEIEIPPEIYTNYQELSTSFNINYIKTLQEQLENCKAEKNYFAEKLKEYESSNLNELIKDLRSKCEKLQHDFQISERLREKSQEVCFHLSTRLEELAIFLDSLLKHKSVLGFLGVHKERKLREIINNSLDLSKSFSVSMIINPNQSLTQLSDITTLLNESTFQDLTADQPKEEQSEEQSVLTIVPSSITLSYQSHLYKEDFQANNDQVINALREQIINLKSELQLRDNELSKFDNVKEISDNVTETDDLYIKETSPTIKQFPQLMIPYIITECQSESEAWSEPDMNVSRERIGLNQIIPVTQSVMESTENESLNSTTPTRKISEKRFSFSELHHQILNLQEDLRMKTDNLRLAEQDLEKMRNLEARFNETKAKLNYTENKLKSVENDIQEFNKRIEELEQTKRELEKKIVVQDKEMQNKINQLELEKIQTSKKAEEFENEVVQGKLLINELEEKVQQMRTEGAEIEERIRKEYDEITSSNMRNIEEQFMEKLNEIEAKAEAKFKEFKEEYSRDYIRRSDVEEKLEELVKLQMEIAAFKSVVRSYEKKIDDYDSKEKDVEYKIQEYQEKIIFLRKEVDSITLQYSEAILEKTKLINEKTSLEQEVNKYRFGGNQLKRQVEDIRTDFERSNIDCQKQIKYLQKCESELEMKVSQLESANAELRNKLVRLQVTTNDFNYSMPELGNKTVHIVPYRRQISEQTSTSEKVLDDCFNHDPVTHENLQAAGDIERREANSSPDLGIESDQGRFSSLEIQNVPRPLLQTLELTESMNNLLCGEENISSGCATCENERCCQKTLEVIYENNSLKRKIQKLGKALQDTIHKLNLANQRKKQVEKTICNQIYKTSQVLRQAKANLDSGNETELKP